MNRGYVKTWRKTLDSNVWEAGPDLFYLWTYFLLKAAHQPRRQKVGYGKLKKEILIDAGQLFCGFSALAKALKMNNQTVRKRVARLEKMNMISRIVIYGKKADWDRGAGQGCKVPIGSIITICNWKQYQSKKDAAKKDKIQGYGTPNKELTTKEVKQIHHYKSDVVLISPEQHQKHLACVSCGFVIPAGETVCRVCEMKFKVIQ